MDTSLPKGFPHHPVACFARRLDAELDLFAIKLLLKSGYSLSKAVQSLKQRLIELPEKLRLIWADRLLLLDRTQAQDEELRQLVPAFQAGLWLLAIEDYSGAATCFNSMLSGFRGSHEVWAALGYAQLMQYCQDLLTEFAHGDRIGHALGTPQFSRSRTKTKLSLLERWKSVVETLREAERLKPGQASVLASLGLAYLFHPDTMGFTEAENYLSAARKALKQQSEPSVAAEIELLVNLGVAQRAAGKATAARELFDETEKLAVKLPAGPRATVNRVLAFNRGLAFAADGKKTEAMKLFVRFLETTLRSDPWWLVGYRHYLKVCESLKIEPTPKDKLQAIAARKPLAVILASGKTIVPGEETDSALSKFGKPTLTTVVCPGTTLRWYRFESDGIEFLAADEDEVLMIILPSSKAPRVTLPGEKPVGQLRVGMTRKEVEALPGGTEFVLRPFAPQPGVRSHYPTWCLTVLYDGDGPDGVVVSILVGAGGI